MTDDKKVKTYFEEKAREFDDIYQKDISLFKKAVNRVFRKGMRQRMALTLRECGESDSTLLDIGCGAGRISLPLARNGLKVTGIDYSEAMIEMARSGLENYRQLVDAPLEVDFYRLDFMEMGDEKVFDITLALGVFDYLEEPGLFLMKMRKHSRLKMIASFPAMYTFQMPIRKLWLLKRNCPVYFFSRKKIETLYKGAGINSVVINKTAAGYLVVSNFT